MRFAVRPPMLSPQPGPKAPEAEEEMTATATSEKPKAAYDQVYNELAKVADKWSTFDL